MRIYYVYSIVFLALGASDHSVTATSLRRRLPDCPLPGDEPCSFHFEQVDCGGCLYNNQCLADAAGQTECTLVQNKEKKKVKKEKKEPVQECPVPSTGLCTLELLPVTCGSNNCPYDNNCLAELAGFTADEECNLVAEEPNQEVQEQTCPTPAAETACGRVYSPVLCPGGCQYDNECLANAVGFTDCSPTEPPNQQVQEQNCPTPAAGTACGFILLPVFCQGGCQYDNECLARAVGFTDCSPTEPFCPTASQDVACTAEANPVECGDFECWYANECWAGAAGFVGCTPAGLVSPCKRNLGVDCLEEQLQNLETIDPSSDIATMDPTMDETGTLTEAPTEGFNNDPTVCWTDVAKFTCNAPSVITAGDNVTSINNVITCDLFHASANLDFQNAENCECSAELSQPIVGTDDIRERTCACTVCPVGSAQAVSLDCSVVPEDPFIVGTCVALDCNSRCIS